VQEPAGDIAGNAGDRSRRRSTANDCCPAETHAEGYREGRSEDVGHVCIIDLMTASGSEYRHSLPGIPRHRPPNCPWHRFHGSHSTGTLDWIRREYVW